jgi:arginine/lysine/ornithine decarboxylase
MHVRKGYVDMARLDRYVHMYQTSSPSYIMMAGIENCIRYMSDEGINKMDNFYKELSILRKKLSGMVHLKLLTEKVVGSYGVYDMDISKIIISTRGTGVSGVQLVKWLREEFHLELEMCDIDYVTAITTLLDTKEGFDRFWSALRNIDNKLKNKGENRHEKIIINNLELPDSRMEIHRAITGLRRKVLISKSEGMISTEFIYIYPPGIPIVVPGEILSKNTIDIIIKYKNEGYLVEGMEDTKGDTIYVFEGQ